MTGKYSADQTRADYEIGRKIAVCQQSSSPDSVYYETLGRCAREALAPAPLPPICGMTVGEIEKNMSAGLFGRGASLSLLESTAVEFWVKTCAAIAHSLARSAPPPDDTNARECAFAFFRVTKPGWNEQDCADAWDREPEEGKNGWRAVAVVKRESRV